MGPEVEPWPAVKAPPRAPPLAPAGSFRFPFPCPGIGAKPARQLPGASLRNALHRHAEPGAAGAGPGRDGLPDPVPRGSGGFQPGPDPAGFPGRCHPGHRRDGRIRRRQIHLGQRPPRPERRGPRRRPHRRGGDHGRAHGLPPPRPPQRAALGPPRHRHAQLPGRAVPGAGGADAVRFLPARGFGAVPGEPRPAGPGPGRRRPALLLHPHQGGPGPGGVPAAPAGPLPGGAGAGRDPRGLRPAAGAGRRGRPAGFPALRLPAAAFRLPAAAGHAGGGAGRAQAARAASGAAGPDGRGRGAPEGGAGAPRLEEGLAGVPGLGPAGAAAAAQRAHAGGDAGLLPPQLRPGRGVPGGAGPGGRRLPPAAAGPGALGAGPGGLPGGRAGRAEPGRALRAGGRPAGPHPPAAAGEPGGRRHLLCGRLLPAAQRPGGLRRGRPAGAGGRLRRWGGGGAL